jgi:ParB-like chromosome segregation protein Spo0J
MVPMQEIRPYWRNPRKNDRAVEPVKASIQRYGMRQPLVLDGERTIIAGHTRYRALKELGATHAPCVIASDLPPARAQEYRLADNSTGGISEWDMEALIPELRLAADADVMAQFFPDMDIGKLLEASSGASRVPDEADVLDAAARARNRFSGESDRAGDDMVDVTCPHCNADFSLSRKELVKG